jgi:hypothetical protein
MTTQINLKFQDGFFELAKEYADSRGYMSIQELVRDALREKIYDDLEIREEYKEILKGEEANTFYTQEESEKFHEELKKRAGMN